VGRFGFVLRRLAHVIPMLLGIVLVVFLLLHVTPGDPARNVAGLRASDEELEQVRADLGIDRPVYVQYASYVGGLVQGDLGYSYKSKEPVSALIGDRVEVTAWLLGAALVIAAAIGLPLALIAARRHDRLADHIVRVACLFGLSMPAFWVGAMLLMLVALRTGWFPPGGFGDDAVGHVHSIVLPGLTLAIGMAPVLIRSLRASILDTLEQDHVATARSIGLSERRIMRRFVLRNASTSTITLIALEIGFLLFGAVVVESTFALPGVGQGLVLAARGRDLPAIQGYTLLFAAAVVVVNLVADIASAIVDPRVEITT
jgi:peptide/nickel transport system permease protein